MWIDDKFSLSTPSLGGFTVLDGEESTIYVSCIMAIVPSHSARYFRYLTSNFDTAGSTCRSTRSGQ